MVYWRDLTLLSTPSTLYFNSIQTSVNGQDSAFVRHQDGILLFVLSLASWKTLPWAQYTNAAVLCQNRPGQPRTRAEWIHGPLIHVWRCALKV